MPIPIATLLYLAGATAAKVAKSALAGSSEVDFRDVGLEVGGELTNVLFAHSVAEKIAEAKERLDHWLERPVRRTASGVWGTSRLERSEPGEARNRFGDALGLYRRISEPYSIGCALPRLARMEADAGKREALLQEIATAWRGIDREDLVGDLQREFAGEV